MKAAARARRDRIRAQLADLEMPGALEALDDVLARVDGGATASEAIEELLGAQITLRNSRRLQAAMRSSRLPTIKTLEDFDFSFQPSVKREQIDSLHELGFLERRENVIFLGPPGVGKTHLAISLAIEAAQSGRRVYYGTLADLITSLEEAKAARTLRARLDRSDLEQGLRRMGRRAGRRGHGRCAHPPPRSPLSHRQHPRQQLPDASSHRALHSPLRRSCGAALFTPEAEENDEKTKGEDDDLERLVPSRECAKFTRHE